MEEGSVVTEYRSGGASLASGFQVIHRAMLRAEVLYTDTGHLMVPCAINE